MKTRHVHHDSYIRVRVSTDLKRDFMATANDDASAVIRRLMEDYLAKNAQPKVTKKSVNVVSGKVLE